MAGLTCLLSRPARGGASARLAALRHAGAQLAPRHAAPCSARRRSRGVCVAAAADEPDVAVFRFTLGIPGFDDAQLPRVLGVLGGVLLAANHVYGASGSAGLGRTEALGLLLSAVCCALPAVGAQLDEARGGVRSTPAAQEAQQAFLLADSLSATARQEAAWATYALLTTTNAGAIVLWRDGAVQLARGALPRQSGAGPADGLRMLTALLAPAAAAFAPTTQAQYFPDASSTVLPGHAELERALAARSVFVQPLPAPSGGCMFIFAPAPRAFNAKARTLIAAVGERLSSLV